MSYRFLSCTVCGTKLRFVRAVKRNRIGCPECGNGMDLAPRDMIDRWQPATAERKRTVPQPEELPATIQHLESSQRHHAMRQFLVGVVAIIAIAVVLVQSGMFRN